MSLLLILMLSGLVSVWSQSTLLDSQCDGHCRNDVEIRRLTALMENMERIMKDTNDRSEKKIMELESKLDSQKTSFDTELMELESKFDSQKTSFDNELLSQKISFDTELSNLKSQLSDQESKFENRIQELDQKVKNQKDTIDQLQFKVSELESKIQTTNVESSTTSGTTPNVIESTTLNVIESSESEDCDDIRAIGYQTSAVYSVNAGNGLIKRVYCEMSPGSKPWTRILHRQDILTDFTYKKWVEYEAGFGDPQGSHWMGLVQMHQLTTSREYKLHVDLEDWEGATRFAVYSVFRVSSGSDKYRLTISNHSGTAGNSMDYHNNMMFTTIDSDNDWCSCNCADGTGHRTGGWWYDGCFTARLTGPYLEGGRVPSGHGIQWPTWRGGYYSYKVATMKIQRR